MLQGTCCYYPAHAGGKQASSGTTMDHLSTTLGYNLNEPKEASLVVKSIYD